MTAAWGPRMAARRRPVLWLAAVLALLPGLAVPVPAAAETPLGDVWAWGRNDDGQLGDYTTTSRSTPVQTFWLAGMAAIAAGGYHSVAVRGDGTV